MGGGSGCPVARLRVCWLPLAGAAQEEGRRRAQTAVGGGVADEEGLGGSSLDRARRRASAPEEDGILKDVHFGYDSTELDERARATSSTRNVDVAARQPARARSSSKGTATAAAPSSTTWRSARKRAKAVKDYLVGAGRRRRPRLHHQLRRGAAALPGRDRGAAGRATAACIRDPRWPVSRAAPSCSGSRSCCSGSGCATRADLIAQERRVSQRSGAAQADPVDAARGRAAARRHRGRRRRRGGVGPASDDRVQELETGSREIETPAPPSRRPAEPNRARGATTSPPPTAARHRRRATRRRRRPAPPPAPSGGRVAARRGARSGGDRRAQRAGARTTSRRSRACRAEGLRARRPAAEQRSRPQQQASHRSRTNALYWAARCHALKGDSNQRAISKFYDVVTKLSARRQGARGALAAGEPLRRAWATRPTRGSRSRSSSGTTRTREEAGARPAEAATELDSLAGDAVRVGFFAEPVRYTRHRCG